MKHGCFAIILTACALAGCQNRAAQELLERELRLQEDRIYELEAQLEQQGGRYCREIPGGIRYEEATEPERYSPAEVESPLDPPPAERTPVRPPRVEPPPSDLEPPTLRPPKVEPPKIQSTPAPKARESSRESTTTAPRFAPPEKREPWEEGAFEIPLDGPSASRPKAKKTSQAKSGETKPGPSVRIAAITLNRVLTGARAGGAGLTVIVEPRDGAGKLQPTAGDVAVVALDPLASGPAARIARWDLAAEDVEHLLAGGSKGIALDLDWPGGTPACRSVNLYVRYVTPDGRELRAEQRLELDVHAPARTTWNKAAPREAQDAIESASDVRTVGHEVEFAPKKKSGPQWSPER